MTDEKSAKSTLLLTFLYPLRFLYGIYAVIVWLVCLLFGGALVLLLPGLAVRRHVARRALRIMFFLGGTPYRFKHLDRIPNRSCVVIANHQSYLDGLLLIAALPPRFSPVIKADMGQLPIIGTVLRRVGSRFVEREPAMAAGRDTLTLLKALETGESLAIFPEGTFAVDRGLLPFRDGAFFLATKAGASIIPVAIHGAHALLPEGGVLPRPAVITATVLQPVKSEDSSREAANQMRAHVENLLLHGLQPAEHPEPHSTGSDYAFYCQAFAQQTLPFAYVDIDRLEQHIRAVLDASGGKRLRVDARVLRSPKIIERIMRSDARFHGVKCATVAEALYLSAYSELDDFLIAYPVVQHALMVQVCAAIADGKGLTLTVDSKLQLPALAQAASDADICLPLCVEIDTSETVDDDNPSRRSAIRDIEALTELTRAIDGYANLFFRGVLVFDIHREPSDRAPYKRADESGGERLSLRRKQLVDALDKAGYAPELVDCAGTDDIRFHAGDPSITEITVGAAFFGLTDITGGELGSDSPAAGYASEIMRQLEPDLYATLSGGYTAPDTHDRALLPRVYLPHGAELDDLSGAGAGQLPIYCNGNLSPGDIIFMYPANASELCERFDRLLLLQQGAIVGTAATYRALGDQFLSADNPAIES